MKIAAISDIHGNSWALRAVLDDIKQKGITEIFDLGDSLYGPLDPKGTYHLLTDRKIESICGNQDREIFENADSSLERHQKVVETLLENIDIAADKRAVF